MLLTTDFNFQNINVISQTIFTEQFTNYVGAHLVCNKIYSILKYKVPAISLYLKKLIF